MESERLLDLLNKYKENALTEIERQELDHWFDTLDAGTVPPTHNELNDDKLIEELLTDFRQKWVHNDRSTTRVRKINFIRKLSRAAAAVAGIGLIGAACFFFFNKPGRKIVQTTQQANHSDIAPPAGSKAVLILGDGSRIELDSAGNGMLATQGKVNIVKQENGQIVYNGANTGIISYNTLSLPEGSKPSKLVLADGSRVWLNTASSITYPTAFTGTGRRVKITGEAYFEITKNASSPFYVDYNGSEVKVLGTHFNVNAYTDEKDSKVTLLEGSVLVSKDDKSDKLKPGQQARISDNEIKVVDDVDMAEVMSWKDGRFYFNGTDIKTIMRQVEKWYNVKVEYESDIDDSFVANISRNENLSELLKILQLTNIVHFKIEGNKITVMK